MKKAILLFGLLSIFTSCEKDPIDVDPEAAICTKYISVPDREPQPWIITDATGEEETEGYTEEGYYFYIVCAPDFILD